MLINCACQTKLALLQIDLTGNEFIEELSTPLIPLTREIVVMPLIGMIDSERAQNVMNALSSGIVTRGARFAVIDITGRLHR